MSSVYRILIAHHRERAAREMRERVAAMFPAEAIGSVVAVDVHTTIGFLRICADEERDRQLLATDCLIADLSWLRWDNGYDLCRMARAKDRDVPCYTIVWSEGRTGKLELASRSAPDTADAMFDLESDFNLRFADPSPEHASNKIATPEQLREGVKWHIRRKLRHLLRQADLNSLLALRTAALDNGEDPAVRDMPVILAGGEEYSARNLFGCCMAEGEELSKAIVKVIDEALTGRRDVVFLELLNLNAPTYFAIHVPPRPNDPTGDLCDRDPQGRPAIRYLRQERLLETVRDRIATIHAAEPDPGPLLDEYRRIRRVCDDIDAMLKLEDDEALRERVRERMGTTDTVRYRHLDGGARIVRQTADGGWGAEETVDLDSVPFKNMWRLRVDEFFHDRYGRPGDEHKGLACGKGCEIFGEIVAFLMFRPFMVQTFDFWTRMHAPVVDVLFGRRVSDVILLFTYSEGRLPPNFGVRGQTLNALRPASLYAQVAGEEAGQTVVMFESAVRPELAGSFWDGFEPPALREGRWRLAFRCKLL